MGDGWDAPQEACFETAQDVGVSVDKVKPWRGSMPLLWVVEGDSLMLSCLEGKSGLHGPFCCILSRCGPSCGSLLGTLQAFAISSREADCWH